ncbi:Acetyltransferase, ribosomal protein N-acetylase [Micrococcus luteus]|uniref:GNAT family N-acetyltransferase n=1 Tax=Micrococcus TaxID=1269 RepID=UPI00044789FC|nr:MULTISPECIES: GNAT family N-acetyltransferase [Micrococcus]EZP42238.1 Acetyltransferase, ribosomal protein N-acetylase [Micrococcus luteus]TQF65853.1 GNAT family N-acetyltransferase [Micrococcus sp. R8502A1]
MPPAPTARLRFREMADADLDHLAGLLGDPVVMRFYPAPRTRAEAAAWIAGNRRRYAQDGHGLWIIETHDDGGSGFVGDCGLTWQEVNGEPRLEVGYHVRADLWGRGYATEAAAACRDHARDVLGHHELVAIIHPENTASRRVAERIGMTVVGEDRTGAPEARAALGLEARTVLGMRLRPGA